MALGYLSLLEFQEGLGQLTRYQDVSGGGWWGLTAGEVGIPAVSSP